MIVGIETHYGLAGSGFESQAGATFSVLIQIGPEAHSRWVPGLCPRLNRPGRSVNYLPISSAEAKEKVQLHLAPLYAFMAC